MLLEPDMSKRVGLVQVRDRVGVHSSATYLGKRPPAQVHAELIAMDREILVLIWPHLHSAFLSDSESQK